MEINNYNEHVIGETGTVTSFDHNSQTILFEHNYENPVIFAQPLSFNGSQTAIVRIEDLQSDRFTAFVQEPSNLDGKHVNESFSYLVLEKGIWQLENNTILEVGTEKTDLLGNKGWENISFAQNFAEAPLVFSQVQTNNDSDFVVTRQRNTSTKGFEITMQEEEALMNSDHGSETLGWFAISAGSGDSNQNQYQAGTTGNQVNHDWHTIKLENSFAQAPVLLASIATYNGTDTAGLRSSDVSNNQIKLKVEEETSKDREIYHTTEEVNYLAIESNSLLSGFNLEDNKLEDSNLGTSSLEASNQVIGETGIVNQLNHNRQTIFLENNYENPVIFTQPLSYNDSQTAIVRIENLQSDRFTAFVQEPNNLDGQHYNESFSYLVVEEGAWELDNGTLLEIGTVETDLPGFKHWSDHYRNVGFAQNFAEAPLVFSQVQTNNDSDFVVTRQKNTSTRGFEITMQEEEALMNSAHGSETLGWLAISPGNGDWNYNQYQAGTTGNRVNSDWHTIKLENSFAQSPVLLASIATYNGAETSGLRLSNLNNNQVDIKVEEDTSRDQETYHTTEAVNFLAIEPNSLLSGSKSDEIFYYDSYQQDFIHIGANIQPWTLGAYFSAVWTSYNFNGNFRRQITGDGEYSQVDIDIKTGGFDAAMERVNNQVRVDEIDSQAKVSSTIDVNLYGSGDWWVGPKLWVNWSQQQERYENYVVENASKSPSEYHDMFTKQSTSRYLGETTHDGSIYKHYYNEHSSWVQFWAVRQDYRTSGSVSLKPILNMWRSNGLPNDYLNNARVNMETYGESTGTVKMYDVDIDMY